MKPLVCPQDFLDADVCALHFVGWRKSGMPAVFEVIFGIWMCHPHTLSSVRLWCAMCSCCAVQVRRSAVCLFNGV